MNTNISEYIAHQKSLLDLERQYEKTEHLATATETNPHKLEATGNALTRLQLTETSSDIAGRPILHLQTRAPRPLTHSRISVGDPVTVRPFAQTPLPATEATVTLLQPRGLAVICDTPPQIDQPFLTASFSVLKALPIATHQRCVTALTRLQTVHDDPTHHAHALVRTLLSYDPPVLNTCPETTLPASPALNDEQAAAVQAALAARTLSVMHGPPGTGKTTALVAYILAELARGSRILVCAPSNSATDHLADRLARIQSSARLVRLGHTARMSEPARKLSLDARLAASDDSALAKGLRQELADLDSNARHNRAMRHASRPRVQELRKELRKREKIALERVLQHAQVVLTTVVGAGAKALQSVVFDVVVIDEAAQLLQAACWVALLRGRKSVLAGDPFQLAGTVKSQLADRGGLKISILDRVFENPVLKRCVHKLCVQYRMHDVICKWSSDEFYDGELRAHDSVAHRRVWDLDGWVAHPDDDELIVFPFVLVDTVGGDCEEGSDGGDLLTAESKRNEGEAAIVVRLCDVLIEKGVRLQDLGIISPYAGQVDLLRDLLWRKFDSSRLEISTVDAFQGREKEIVILSLVRSNEAGDIGFLSDARRLNVAITRAKRCVMVVCDSETVGSSPLFERLFSYVEASGVYRSAVVEFEDVVGTFSLGRRPKEAIHASSDANDQASSRTTPKLSGPSTQTQPPKSRRRQQARTLQRRPPELHDRDRPEENEDELRTALKGEVLQFNRNQFLLEKRFSADLSSLARRVVHELAEEFGLRHGSEGVGHSRQVRIWKSGAFSPVFEALAETGSDSELSGRTQNLGFDEEFVSGGGEGERDGVGDGDEDDVAVNDNETEEDSGGGDGGKAQDDLHEYADSNSLLKDMRETRERRQRELQTQSSEREGADVSQQNRHSNTEAQNDTGGQRQKKKRNKKSTKKKKQEEEDLDFEAVLREYGHDSRDGTGSGSSASAHGQARSQQRFSPAVASIVNGVLTQPTAPATARERDRRAAQIKLARKLASENEKRKRKGKE